MRQLVMMLAAICFATGAAAQERFFDPSALVKDKTLRWRTDNGQSSVTYLGRNGRAYMFTQVSPSRTGGDPVVTLCWVDGSGQVYRARVNGQTIRFKPNDCALTPGRCEYDVVFPDGSTSRYIRHSTVRGNRWSYRLYNETEDAEGIVERGVFLLDDAGFFIRRDWTRFTEDGPSHRWSRRIR